MGKTQSKPEDSKNKELEEAKQIIKEKGVEGAQIVMREKLEEWRNVKIKFGVTGMSGVGKSKFINSVRGIEDDDERAAKSDFVETTLDAECYTYPDNPNITLVDLPGIGTPTFPDLKTYCKKVDLESYDTFLILTATRFTQYDLELAQKIKSIGKSLFLVRTKIDVDEANENRKKDADIKVMQEKIRAECHKYIKGFGIDEEKIFLISNHHQKEWDFQRLVLAIVEKLSDRQKEAFTLSLSLKHLSRDIVKEKVKVLRGQLSKLSTFTYATFSLDNSPISLICWILSWYTKVFFQRAAIEDHNRQKQQPDLGAVSAKTETSRPAADFTTFVGEFESSSKKDLKDSEIPVEYGMGSFISEASMSLALAVFGRKAAFYRSQLGLPEEDSKEFQMMKAEFQNRMSKFYLKEDEGYWRRCLKTFSITFTQMQESSKTPHEVIRESLENLLDKMQELSLDILDDTAADIKEEMDLVHLGI